MDLLLLERPPCANLLLSKELESILKKQLKSATTKESDPSNLKTMTS